MFHLSMVIAAVLVFSLVYSVQSYYVLPALPSLRVCKSPRNSSRYCARLESVGFVFMAIISPLRASPVWRPVAGVLQLANDLAVGRIEQQRLGRG